MIFPTKRQPDEEYPSVIDLLRMDDLPTCDVIAPNWQINGKRVLLHVRALSLRDQEAVRRASRIAAAKIADLEKEPNHPAEDLETFMLETWLRGVMTPKFDREQVQGLRSRQAHALHEVTTLIWAISSMDQETIERLIIESTPADTLAVAARSDADQPSE